MLKKFWVQSLIAAVISITVVGSAITHESKIATTATVSDVWVNDCDTKFFCVHFNTLLIFIIITE